MAATWDYEQASVDALVQEAPLQDDSGQIHSEEANDAAQSQADHAQGATPSVLPAAGVSAALPCALVWARTHRLAKGRAFDAANVLRSGDDGDTSENCWAMPDGETGDALIVQLSKPQRVRFALLVGSGSNDSTRARGLAEFELALSTDGLTWTTAAVDMLPNVRGSTPSERRDRARHIQHLPTVSVELKCPEPTAFVKLAVRSFYGAGAALRRLRLLPVPRAESQRETFPGISLAEIVLADAAVLDAWERHLWRALAAHNYESGATPAALARGCSPEEAKRAAVIHAAAQSHYGITLHRLHSGAVAALHAVTATPRNATIATITGRELAGWAAALVRNAAHAFDDTDAYAIYHAGTLFRDLILNFTQAQRARPAPSLRPFAASHEPAAMQSCCASPVLRPTCCRTHAICQGCNGLLWGMARALVCEACPRGALYHECCGPAATAPQPAGRRAGNRRAKSGAADKQKTAAAGSASPSHAGAAGPSQLPVLPLRGLGVGPYATVSMAVAARHTRTPCGPVVATIVRHIITLALNDDGGRPLNVARACLAGSAEAPSPATTTAAFRWPTPELGPHVRLAETLALLRLYLDSQPGPLLSPLAASRAMRVFRTEVGRTESMDEAMAMAVSLAPAAQHAALQALVFALSLCLLRDQASTAMRQDDDTGTDGSSPAADLSEEESTAKNGRLDVSLRMLASMLGPCLVSVRRHTSPSTRAAAVGTALFAALLRQQLKRLSAVSADATALAEAAEACAEAVARGRGKGRSSASARPASDSGSARQAAGRQLVRLALAGDAAYGKAMAARVVHLQEQARQLARHGLLGFGPYVRSAVVCRLRSARAISAPPAVSPLLVASLVEASAPQPELPAIKAQKLLGIADDPLEAPGQAGHVDDTGGIIKRRRSRFSLRSLSTRSAQKKAQSAAPAGLSRPSSAGLTTGGRIEDRSVGLRPGSAPHGPRQPQSRPSSAQSSSGTLSLPSSRPGSAANGRRSSSPVGLEDAPLLGFGASPAHVKALLDLALPPTAPPVRREAAAPAWETKLERMACELERLHADMTPAAHSHSNLFDERAASPQSPAPPLSPSSPSQPFSCTSLEWTQEPAAWLRSGAVAEARYRALQQKEAPVVLYQEEAAAVPLPGRGAVDREAAHAALLAAATRNRRRSFRTALGLESDDVDGELAGIGDLSGGSASTTGHRMLMTAEEASAQRKEKRERVRRQRLAVAALVSVNEQDVEDSQATLEDHSPVQRSDGDVEDGSSVYSGISSAYSSTAFGSGILDNVAQDTDAVRTSNISDASKPFMDDAEEDASDGISGSHGVQESESYSGIDADHTYGFGAAHAMRAQGGKEEKTAEMGTPSNPQHISSGAFDEAFALARQNSIRYALHKQQEDDLLLEGDELAI